MVRLDDKQISQIGREKNMTIKTFKEWTSQNIPNYKNLTQDQFKREFTQKLREADERRQAAARLLNQRAVVITSDDVAKPTHNPYRFINRDLPTEQLYTTFIRPNPTGNIIPLPPLPPDRQPNQRGRPRIPYEYPDSDDIWEMITAIRRRFRPTPVSTLSEANNFRRELEAVIYEHSPSDRTAKYIIQHLNFVIRPIRTSALTGMYYVMKNGYRDFGDFVLQTFCVEPPEVENPYTKKSFGCFYRCCIYHIPRLFGTTAGKKKLGIFESENPSKVTFDIIEKAAKHFNFDAIGLDIELSEIFRYEHYNSSKDDKNSRQVILVIKDNHVSVLKPAYKKWVVPESGCSNLVRKPQSTFYVAPTPEVGEFQIANGGYARIEEIEPNCLQQDEDGNTLDSGEPTLNLVTSVELSFTTVKPTYILAKAKPKDAFPPISLSNKQVIYYVECYEDILLIYDYYRKTKGQVGKITECGKNEFQVVILSDNTYYYRTRQPLDFDDKYPAEHTLSISSLSRHLFTVFISQEYPKILNRMLYTAFKGLCRPMKTMEVGEWRGHIYVFDLIKAYHTASTNLFIPKLEIEWKEGVYSSSSYDIDGGGEKEALILISDNGDDGKWKIPTPEDNNTPYKARVLIDRTTSELFEYGKHLQTIRPSDWKQFFNSLIGCMHPADLNQARTLFCHSESDFARFMMYRDGKEIVDIDIDHERNFYKIKFLYDNDYTNGLCLPYFPAQIIQRCNDKVKRMRERILSFDDQQSDIPRTVKLIGTMTDSVIVCSSTPLPKEFLDEQTEWCVKGKIGSKIHSRGVGRYRIWDSNGNVIGGTKAYEDTPMSPSEVGYYSSTQKKTTTPKEFDFIDTYVVERIFTSSNPRRHRLIIGEPGVGKSRWILNEYCDRSGGDYIMLASTGIAAASVGGQTVHSTFGIRPLNNDVKDVITEPYEILRRNRIPAKKIYQIQRANVIIIDEAFMMEETIMNTVDILLQIVCNSTAIFGGKQLVLVGDDRQLTAVLKPGRKSFFESQLYSRLNVDTHTIKYDPTTSRMVNDYHKEVSKFRNGNLTISQIIRYIDEFKEKTSTLHIPTNKVSGVSNVRNEGIHAYFTNEEVERHNNLKRKNSDTIEEGEPLLLRTNVNISKGLYNGKIGKAVYIDGNLYFVNDKGEKCMLDSKKQIKYQLAYAITIHKSQGLTLPSINLGIDRALELAKIGKISTDTLIRLIYVGLSRVRTFEDVYFI